MQKPVQPVNREKSQLSTFEKSCRHWSERSRAEMDAFYRLAADDYRLLAEQLDWRAVFRKLGGRFGPVVRLLDVACGSGQFPSALLAHGGLQRCDNLTVEYSLLDPSRFSIRTARRKLADPFAPDAEHHCTLQNFPAPACKYAILWATHALYCVPHRELSLALDRVLAALDPAGLGFIAHASRHSHYLQFHELYLKHSSVHQADPFSTGEDIIETLRGRLGRSAVVCWSVDYEGVLDLKDRDTAERYLQRCLFDDTIPLDNMLADPRLGPYLRRCVDDSRHTWRFPQKVWLVFFGGLARFAAAQRRSDPISRGR